MLFEDNITFRKNNNLTALEDGFKKGNMFNDLYIPYKNYEPALIKPSGKKEYLLYEIMMLNFAIIDLNLYLDLNPNNQGMLKKFNDLVKICFKKEDEYVKEYGPLMVKDSDNKEFFSWLNGPWPWQKEDGKYV